MKHIKVCVRTKPTQSFAQDNLVIDHENNTIQILKKGLVDDSSAILNNKQNSFSFKFDHVFHNSTQTEIYDLYARDVVQGVVDGINGAILTYGQTGSGKTFTMNGDPQNYEHRGVAPRALSQIFAEINARVEYEFVVSCSYIEIYNEKVFDLLTDLSSPDQVRDYKRDKVTEVSLSSESDALNILFTGELARTTATHRLNRKSNRSHSLFTVYLEQRQRSGISEKVVTSKLVLTDLAGSERLKKTMDNEDGHSESDEAIRRESICINQSLTYLEQCIIALSRKGQNYIPYRQSKLTTILKDCLGSNCNTLMLACIWGESDHLEETVSTLRLASRMMRVQNETTVTQSVDPSALIKKQDRLIKALKQELLMHDALVERTGVTYDPFTPEQQTSIAHMIDKYVDAKEDKEEEVLSFISVRQMLEVCKQFKKMVLQSRAEVDIAREEMHHVTYNSAVASSWGADKAGENSLAAETKLAEEYDPKKQSYVGVVETSGTGFPLGLAAGSSRPLTSLDTLSYSESKIGSKVAVSPKKDPFMSPTSPKSVGKDDFDNLQSPGYANDDQAILLDNFIAGPGLELRNSFVESKRLAKELKSSCKELSTTVNSAKASIDELQRKMQIRKESRIEMLKRSGFKASEAEDIVDEEELSLMRDLKEAKRLYKNSYESYQRQKEQLALASSRADQAKSGLAAGYLGWCRVRSGDGQDYYPESVDDGSDQLDNQETFDKLETQRVLSRFPDSLPYFNAQKTRKALLNQNGSTIRQAQKNKRLG